MFNISSYLEKISKAVGKSELEKKEICGILEVYLGAAVREECVDIKGTSIHLSLSPAAKNKIFLKKNIILEKINSISQTKITDIT